MNNSLFLRYYNQWREDPSSVVFVPVADYFLMYGQAEDAHKVCLEGLKRNPDSVAGRMVLVKVHLAKGELKKADEVCAVVLERVPTHTRAQELRIEIDLALRGDIGSSAVGESAVVEQEIIASVVGDEDVPEEETVDTGAPAAWQTTTMTKAFKE